MQRKRFFLKGSATETAWLNRLAIRGYQLTAVRGWTYQFKRVSGPVPMVVAEYVPVATLEAIGELLRPLATYQFKNGCFAVTYTAVAGQGRVVRDDDRPRLAVYRHARDVALNWMNGWVVGIWILMCLSIFASTQLTATPWLTRLFLSGLGLGAALIVAGIVGCATAALRCHRVVCRLIQVTGDDKDAWKPTFHVLFKHQPATPDTERFAELGQWQLTMHNQHGDYYFDLRTTLSETEIRTAMLKMIKQQDFTVMSWLGLYPL